MKLTIFDTHKFEEKSLIGALEEKYEVVFHKSRLNLKTAILAKESEAISVFVNDTLSAQVISKLASFGVKFILLRCAGYNNVDLKACREFNIKVANVPEYSPYAVAEHTVAMILALNRKLIRANRRILELNFSLDGLVGFDLNQKTVGIVGLGKIGLTLAKIISGFGCEILAYDVHEDSEVESKYNLKFVSLSELCKSSDIISLHVPVTKDTYHLINEDRLKTMKKGCMLINTSRGALIDSNAVIDSLKLGHLGYLGIDVYEEEAGLFFEDHSDKELLQDDTIARLMTFKNVLITSHQAFLTDTALKNIADTTVLNLDQFRLNNSCENELF